MRRLVAAVAVLLVGGLVAFWWARTGSERALTTSSATSVEEPVPAAPAEKVAEPAARMLVVTVRDAGSGAPLSGATVAAKPWNGAGLQVVTDAEGRAELPPVSGKVTASHRGRAPQCERVGLATSQLIFLLRPGPPVHGRVVHAGARTGIEGASVVVTEIDSSDTVTELVTDAEGRFEVPGMTPDAPFLLVAERAGVPPVGRVERKADPSREIVLELGGAAVLEGKVIRPDGTIAGGAKVRVWPRGGEPVIPEDLPFGIPDYEVETATDAEGRFRIEGLRVPSVYVVEAKDDRLSSGRADDVEFRAAGETAWREIRLVARTLVHVEVIFPPGVPWPHPSVYLRHGDDHEKAGVGRDGYTYAPKATGPHEVGVNVRSWPRTRIPIDVREGYNAVVVRMSREGHRLVSGQVTAENGAPVGGGDIHVLFKTSEGDFRTYATDEGTFHLCDIPAVEGTIEVRDARGIFGTWTRAGVAPGAHLEVQLRAAARFVGRVDPVPASRRIPVRRRNRSHWPPGDNMEEIGSWLVPLDERGGFEIPWAPGVRIALAFDPPDAAPLFRDEAPLADGEVRDLGVLRLEPGRGVEGVVVDDTGRPVADCRLHLEFLAGGDGMVILSGAPLDDRTTYTAADGRFRFSRLPETPVGLELSAEGFVGRALDLPSPVGLEALEIRLVRAGMVEGVLKAADGRPVAGETVECVTAERDEPFRGRTDSIGRFRVIVAPGKHLLKYGDQAGPTVEVRAGETTRVEFRLEE